VTELDPSASSARRYLLAALAIAVAVGVFLLVWELRGAERSRLSAPRRAEPEVQAPPREPAAAPRLPGRDAAPPDLGVASREPDDAPSVPLAESLAAASRYLQDDLRACEARDDDSSGVITVSYAVVFEGGGAKVDDARVMNGSLSAELQDCALDRIRSARWDAPGAADTRARRVDTFVVGAAY